MDYVNHLGWTPLLYAICYGNTVMAEMLIEHGADVNNCDFDDWSPLLMHMSRNMCLEIPSQLCPNIEQVKDRQFYGWLFERNLYHYTLHHYYTLCPVICTFHTLYSCLHPSWLHLSVSCSRSAPCY